MVEPIIYREDASSASPKALIWAACVSGLPAPESEALALKIFEKVKVFSTDESFERGIKANFAEQADAEEEREGRSSGTVVTLCAAVGSVGFLNKLLQLCQD